MSTEKSYQDTIAMSLDAEFTAHGYEDGEFTSEDFEDDTPPSNQVVAVDAQNYALEKAVENEKSFDEAKEYVNDNMKRIIDMGMDGLSELMGVMNDSQDARMYNSCASFIKTLVDANKTYLDNNKPIGGVGGKGVKEKPEATSVTNIQVNNGEVKLMSPNDLLDME